MRIDPEGPERVVKVEDEHFGQGAAVLEGLWRERVRGEGGGGRGRAFWAGHCVGGRSGCRGGGAGTGWGMCNERL